MTEGGQKGSFVKRATHSNILGAPRVDFVVVATATPYFVRSVDRSATKKKTVEAPMTVVKNITIELF